MLATSAARRVGSYEIGAEIGRGATSRVFAAQHVGMARRVAFKELSLRADGDTSPGERFLTEARITASISHPNVVPAHDYVEHDGGAALVLEQAARGSLRHHIRQGLGLAQAGGVLEDVLAGLAQLESQEIVHLDLKPDNLLVTAAGRIKIADFGTARSCAPAELDAHDDEFVIGTPHYLAPEQARCGRVGPWTDLYGVGTLAFEMLVGRAPYAGTTDPVEVVHRQLHDPVPRVCDLVPGMSPDVADWIGWLVAKAPADRPRSAAEAWDALGHVLADLLGPSWRLAAGL